MARTPNPKNEPIELVQLPEQQIIENQNVVSMHSSVLSIQFDNGLPYERERVVNEARFFAAQSAESMLEFGKRLILIKENEPQGEFHHILKSRLNLVPRTAQLMMQAAIKYLSPKLQSNAQALSHLGKTKLFELMTEDDEILAELADGGTVASRLFHGVPKVIYWDKGSANTASAIKNLLDHLEVTYLEHEAGNARAKGGVENANNIIETQFEIRACTLTGGLR
ncbi:DUF3102 domain-containing protein [Limnobaculum sp. M2-1]|uniref:DUF3102 domain-containing protein n=1 Tax=Limnobaculum TaxID=2172100 RepID=UPI001C490F9B|nr:MULTISPECIES: DUF3102 domain-containing protein [Limnobaculum]MBV7693324.1 DUF3102 domain-containing protein [Limnobaculum sp. M2-1]